MPTARGAKRKAQKPLPSPTRTEKKIKAENEMEDAAKKIKLPLTEDLDVFSLLTSEDLEKIRGPPMLFHDEFQKKGAEYPFYDCNSVDSTLSIGYDTERWAYKFGAKSLKDIKHLSASQRHTIISSLKGYCIQESWHTLIRRLPHRVKHCIVQYFLQALLMKDIYTKIYENPFWYLDGKIGPEDEEGDDRFGARLCYLMERFMEVDPREVSLWRSDTCRLANVIMKCQGRSLTLGNYHSNRRTQMIEQMATDFLASEPVCWLLKPGDPEMARESLLFIYAKAATAITRVSCGRGNFRYLQLDGLGKTYKEESGMMRIVQDQLGLALADRISGQPILLVVVPAICRQWITYNKGDAVEICTQARVIVQEKKD